MTDFRLPKPAVTILAAVPDCPPDFVETFSTAVNMIELSILTADELVALFTALADRHRDRPDYPA